jgi:hypothetical protein
MVGWRPHRYLGATQDGIGRNAVDGHCPRLEALGDLVSVEATRLAWREVLADVLRQVTGGEPGLTKSARPDRKVTKQRDVDEPVPPSSPDLRVVDVPTSDEVHVESMAAGMPLGHPQIREAAPDGAAEPPKEVAHVLAQPSGIVTTLAPVRERRQTVQPVSRAIPPDFAPGAPHAVPCPSATGIAGCTYVDEVWRLAH